MRHLDLGVLDLADLDGEVGGPDLVGPHHRLEHDHVVLDPEHRDAGALPQRDGHHGHPVGVEQGLAQQAVGLGAGLLGLEVVGLLEQHRVDLLGGHELLDGDLARGRRGQALHVLVGEDDHLAVLGLVALGDVGVGDLLAVDRADALVLDPAAVLGVHLTERDVVRLGRGVQLHRHADQPEGHRALPDRPHARSSRRRPRTAIGDQCDWWYPQNPWSGDRMGACSRCSPPKAPTCRPTPGWSHEVKWDGVRVLADTATGGKGGTHAAAEPQREPGHDRLARAQPQPAGRPRPAGRRRGDRAQRARAAGLPGAPGPDARPQRDRGGPRSPSELPATYMVFDVMRLDGRDLTALPLDGAARRSWRTSASSTRPGRCRSSYDDGPMLFEATLQQGLEGIVSKRLTSRYSFGRAQQELAEVRAPAPPLVRRRRLASAGGDHRPAGRAAGGGDDPRGAGLPRAGSAAASAGPRAGR